MHQNLTRGLPMVACLLTLVNAATSATYVDVRSETQLNNLRITVIDLDLTDGIAAGFSYADTPLRRSSKAFVRSTGLPDAFNAVANNKNFGPAGVVDAVGGFSVTGTAHAEVAGTGMLSLPTSLSSGQSLSFASMPPNGVTLFRARSRIDTRDYRRDYVGTARRFIVTPSTRIIFTASFEASTEFDINNDPMNWGSNYWSAVAGASVYFQGGLYNSTGQWVGGASASDYGSVSANQLLNCGYATSGHMRKCEDVSVTAQDVLSTSFDTGAGQQFEGEFGIGTSSYVRAQVPEPASMALMLTGLGAIGMASRARRRGGRTAS